MATKSEEGKEERGYVGSSQAARYLNMHAGTLANMRCRGVGPRFWKVGSKVLYKYDDLDAFVEAGGPLRREG